MKFVEMKGGYVDFRMSGYIVFLFLMILIFIFRFLDSI